MIKINSLTDCIKNSAANYPKHIALEFMGRKTKYSDLALQIDAVSRSLIALGHKRGDIICIAMPNMPQAILLIYAANQLGITVNMIHPLSSESEILSFVNRVNASTVLVLDQFYAAVARLKDESSVKNIIVASAAEALPSLKSFFYKLSQKGKIQIPFGDGLICWNDFLALGKGRKLPLCDCDLSEDTALILHSGGTTGKVKGVMLSNRSVNASSKQMLTANPMIDSTDRMLSVMPIFHGNGLVVGIHSMLTVGARCILIPRFTPKSYAKDLLKHRCNYMSGVPVLFENLMLTDEMKDADLSFLKGVFSGADSLSVELERKINAFLKAHNAKLSVRQGYGMTEGVVASTLMPFDKIKEGSIGKALPGVEIKIIEPGTENELKNGEVGEIVFSSETNMKGYYNNPEESALVMRKHSDEKIWIHSGDLGYVDEEGFIFFKGRIKRMIVSNGYNIFPGELENIIEGFDIVKRCCVLGFPVSEGSEKIKAFIVLSDGVEKSEDTKEKIMELCRKYIARYSLPKEIEFIDELPKTKVGKVDYNALLKK